MACVEGIIKGLPISISLILLEGKALGLASRIASIACLIVTLLLGLLLRAMLHKVSLGPIFTVRWRLGAAVVEAKAVRSSSLLSAIELEVAYKGTATKLAVKPTSNQERTPLNLLCIYPASYLI